MKQVVNLFELGISYLTFKPPCAYLKGWGQAVPVEPLIIYSVGCTSHSVQKTGEFKTVTPSGMFSCAMIIFGNDPHGVILVVTNKEEP